MNDLTIINIKPNTLLSSFFHFYLLLKNKPFSKIFLGQNRLQYFSKISRSCGYPVVFHDFYTSMVYQLRVEPTTRRLRVSCCKFCLQFLLTFPILSNSPPYEFIRSFVCSFIHLFIPSFICSFLHSSIHSLPTFLTLFVDSWNEKKNRN